MAKGVRVNRPKKALQRNHQKLGRVNKQRRKKQNEAKKEKTSEKILIDPLTTTDILKKRRTNPKANITLSGKKRRLLTKKLQRKETRDNQMEVIAAKKEKEPEKIKDKGSKQNEKMEMEIDS
eukprot:Seg1393.6 transcript_id=Seg1393.6/GoldUCD/mRNA.D3Y31 product="hypothetical protein" protein_id=Seg1393.6/GoldUCD/D3Y31